ncbi:peptidase M50 [Raphidocelis subcapitata]|uniref:Peptidase M50 n=1 Tax=Raphidocelis subcapitata TaxID=307507 RepID=A0A2V0PDY9_9CHLO|nr:peptidase M50 [Raphidocelis subcapitata]|eukprot:GBF98071.1 peptidase M50 [Raphidocelis subcapitata]
MGALPAAGAASGCLARAAHRAAGARRCCAAPALSSAAQRRRRSLPLCRAEPVEGEGSSTPTTGTTPPAADAPSAPSGAAANGGPEGAAAGGGGGGGGMGRAPVEGADRADLQIPKAVIEKLRYSVFGYNTLWVTSVDNYQESGVVFKGNLRAKDPAAAYEQMKERLKAELGDSWQIFLVEDKEEKPTAVVLPATAREGEMSKLTEVWLAVAFATLTCVTSLNSAGVPMLQFLVDPFHTALTAQDVTDALPLVGAFWLTLLAHEAGHRVAAARRGVGLYLPLIVPAGFGFLGSFGGITRFRGFVRDRAALLDVAAAGPAAGAAVSGGLLAAGLALSAAGLGDVTVDSAAFADSWSVALLAQAALGDALTNPEVRVSSLVVAGWAGLVVNALNCMPAGELDGGRISVALFGRRGATALGVLTTAALAISSFASTLAGYWILLLLALQRGPLLPCQQEIAPPSDPGQRRLGYALLVLPLLVLPPLPVELVLAVKNMAAPTLTF